MPDAGNPLDSAKLESIQRQIAALSLQGVSTASMGIGAAKTEKDVAEFLQQRLAVEQASSTPGIPSTPSPTPVWTGDPHAATRAAGIEWANYCSEMLGLNRTMVDKLDSIDRRLAELLELVRAAAARDAAREAGS